MQIITKLLTENYQTRPKVSVCLGSFNGDKFIKTQVSSILAQLECDDELVVSDNGSTDTTLRILEEFNDTRLLIRHCQISGVCPNFENAIASSSGDILILSDQDDVWLPGRVNAALESLKAADLSVVAYRSVDSNLNSIPLNTRSPKLSLFKTFALNGYTGCCMAMRRSVLDVVLPFPIGLPMHDWWIAILCLIFFKVNVSHDAYILYRRHGFNASATGQISTALLGTKLKLRLTMFAMIFYRYLKVKFFSRGVLKK